MKLITELVQITDGKLKIKDKVALLENLDDNVYNAVFEPDPEKKKRLLTLIKEAVKAEGVYPASIHELYIQMGKMYPGFTVPAINVRGLTYDTAKAIFRRMEKHAVGAVIFEIARSEIGYTKQRPLEYSTVVLAAALKEGYKGPVFIQGDHFQLTLKGYKKDAQAEINYIKGLIAEAIDAEFYNIDIDASTLVDLSKPTVKEQQRPNFEMTAELAKYIRQIQPSTLKVSVGGEIGEIGGKNSNPDELRAFLDGFKETFKGQDGLSKLSVQTGTSHGGVVLPDGTLAKVKIDFDTLRILSDLARKEYGLSGCVQHGASTLPDEAFDMFPKTGTSEVHLATGFQNIMYDSKALPQDFRKQVYELLKKEFASEKKEGETEEQFIYKTRKKGFGSLKREWWDLHAKVKGPIMDELEDKFQLLFEKLRVLESRQMVLKTISPVYVNKLIEALV